MKWMKCCTGTIWIICFPFMPEMAGIGTEICLIITAPGNLFWTQPFGAIIMGINGSRKRQRCLKPISACFYPLIGGYSVKMGKVFCGDEVGLTVFVRPQRSAPEDF